MSKDVHNRPTVICKGYARSDGSQVNCGNTLYESTYGFDASVENPKPIWRCTNCQAETPRVTRTRQSLSMKRWQVIDQLKTEWQETEAKLHELLEAGKIKGGALLVHGFNFNYNIEALRKAEKPTRWDLSYHTSQARRDLENAKKFVNGQEAR